MEVMAGLALSLLGTGYYLNDPNQNKNTSNSASASASASPADQFSVQAPASANSSSSQNKICQSGGGGALGNGNGNGNGNVTSGMRVGLSPVPTPRTPFEAELLGVFTPEYYDSQNTYSQYKQSNPSYQPGAVFKHFDPAVQAIIKQRVNLDQLRQKKHKYPLVKDAVIGVLNNAGNPNVNHDFNGVGSGSAIDSGNQAELPHRENVDHECDLTHNNMVPFFGSQVTQNTDIDNRLATHKLELYTGQYNLRQQNKKEVKSLFPPVANLTNVYGSHETRDLSRYFPNNHGKKNNELPFEQIQVGPGLNQGFKARASGGYHDQIRILPKSNEELYVNPKSENKGKIIYGKALVSERGQIGNVYKYAPTLLVDNRCGQRNFTTVGEVRAPRVRSGVILKNTDRSQLNKPAITPAKFAVSQNSTENMIPCTKISNKQNFKNTPYRNTFQTRGKKMNDFGASGYQNRPNERSVTGPKSYEQAYRALTRSSKNIIKSLDDKQRFTRKQEYIVHPRPYGNLESNGPNKGPVYDPNHVARTTVKETTSINQYGGAIQSPQQKNPVYNPEWTAKVTTKETTESSQYAGTLQTPQKKSPILSNDWSAKVTIREISESSQYAGSLQSPQKKNPVYDPDYTARTTIRETTSEGNTMGAINRTTLQDGGGYKVGNFRPRNTQRQYQTDLEYYSPAGAVENKAAQNYDSAYNAELNINKEQIARGRKPTQQGVKLNKGKDYYNIEINKQASDQIDTREQIKDSTIGNRFNPNAVAECTVTSFKNIANEDYHRLDPTLLEPFRKNGLTQSLHSF